MYWTKLAGLPRLLSSPFCGWQGSQKESWTVFTQLSSRSFGGLPQECEGRAQDTNRTSQALRYQTQWTSDSLGV